MGTTSTSGSSAYVVAVVDPVRASAVGVSGLSLASGISDATISRSAPVAEVSVPATAFAHTNTTAVVTLSAAESGKNTLPNGVSFDATTGKFTIAASAIPANGLKLTVTAKDETGKAVTTTFTVRSETGTGQGQGQGRGDIQGQGRSGQGRSGGAQDQQGRGGPQTRFDGRSSFSDQLKLARKPLGLSERIFALSQSAKAAARVV